MGCSQPSTTIRFAMNSSRNSEVVLRYIALRYLVARVNNQLLVWISAPGGQRKTNGQMLSVQRPKKNIFKTRTD